MCVTAHWSSHPSLGHLVFAWPGFLIGAGQSWNNTTPQVIRLIEYYFKTFKTLEGVTRRRLLIFYPCRPTLKLSCMTYWMCMS